MLKQFINIWCPAIDHYKPHSQRFFEGWYYKLVNAAGDRSFAIIPGVYVGTNPEESQAFIQIVEAHRNRSYFVSYPLSQFSGNDDRFSIFIDKSNFSLERMVLNIHSSGLDLEGSIGFINLSPWPVSLFSPGIMGWFGLLPFLECYHGVLSLEHRLEGLLCINGESVDLTGGKGYIEKNWGHNFPSTWIWMQANHFAEEHAAFMASIALVPLGKWSFPGLIAGVKCHGRLYRFATYLGSHVEDGKFDPNEVSFSLVGRQHKLVVRATMRAPIPLLAPGKNGMTATMAESLTSSIHLSLYQKNQPLRPLFAESSEHAGLEIAGNLAHLLD